MAKPHLPSIKEAVREGPKRPHNQYVPLVPAENFGGLSNRNARQKKRAAFWKHFAETHPPTPDMPRKVGKSPLLAAPYGRKKKK